MTAQTSSYSYELACKGLTDNIELITNKTRKPKTKAD